MTKRIFVKLILALIGLLVVAALGVDYFVSRTVEANLRRVLEDGLKEEAQLAVAALRGRPAVSDPEVVDEIAEAAGARLTLIRSDGVVLVDSEADPATMENHSTRPEFVAALAGEVGVSTRFSATVGTEFLYVAIPREGGALRLALPLSEIRTRTEEARGRILRVTLVAFIPAVFLALWLAQRLSARLSQVMSFSRNLARGDFQTPVPAFAGGELGELSLTLQTTADRLRSMFEQLKEERSRFAAAVNGIGAGVLVVDVERRAIVCNPAMRRMFPNENLTVGDRPFTAAHGDITRLFDRVFSQATSDSVDLSVSEPVKRSWKVSCVPIGGATGRVQAAVAVFYDITELEETERVRRDFVTNVSHELRTPLASIQGYAETLLDGAVDDPQHNRRFLQIIRQNAERLAQLSSDLMTLSQIEVRARDFDFAPVAVTDLLTQASDSIRALTDRKRVSVRVEGLPVSTKVECDSDSLHQVLMNLLENAAKYSPEGGAITLGARRDDDEVEFYVRDTGVGIPSDHIPRLFERFYRVDKARSRELGGTGLGLAIVKHLVLAHDGSVRVESEVGQGSTFYVRIPVQRSQRAVEVDVASGAGD